MKPSRWIISALAGLFAYMSYAQTDLDSLYDKAQQLNQQKEFTSAARLFADIQDKAYEIGDISQYILAITAEGECYYMLDLVNDLKYALDKAESAFGYYSDQCDTASRLYIEEAICKLRGSYYSCLTDYDHTAFQKALDTYSECLEIIGHMKSEYYTSFDDKELEITVRRELLSLYYKQKQYDKALKEADAIYIYRRDIGYDSRDKSPAGIREYDRYVDAYVSRAMVLARLNRFEKAKELLSEMTEECKEEPSYLRTMGKILMLQYAVEGIDQRKTAKDCYQRFITLFRKEFDSQLATLTDSKQEQYWLAIHDFLHDCYCLGEYAADMLYDMALFSKGYLLKYKTDSHTEQTSWRDISKALQRDECAIEFVQYKNHHEEKHMAALIVRKDFKYPRFVDLGPVKDIMSTPLYGNLTVGDAIADDVGRFKDRLYSDDKAFRIIWNEDITALIKDCRNIYFAPDGFIHQLAIEYKYPDPSVSCYRLSSTSTLLTQGNRISGDVLLCGGIDYYAEVQSRNVGNDINGYNMFKGKSIYINALNGAEAEVDSIAICTETNDERTICLLKGEQATEDMFSSMTDDGFSIIHVATHGYFSGENDFTDMKNTYRDKGMSESGLIMAGAATNINDKGFDPSYSDGIITANELSKLDLGDVGLVVLSACQSGLGYITEDGVYGIQRALKISGAKSMIVSLWSVDDEATMMFMKSFYNELCNSSSETDIHMAFNAARAKLKNEESISVNRFSSKSLTRRQTKRTFSTPMYTDAFILIDGI